MFKEGPSKSAPRLHEDCEGVSGNTNGSCSGNRTNEVGSRPQQPARMHLQDSMSTSQCPAMRAILMCTQVPRIATPGTCMNALEISKPSKVCKYLHGFSHLEGNVGRGNGDLLC